MASFPSALPSFTGFTSSHTLAADNHAAQHNLEQAEVLAIATKLGTGSTTASNNTVLRGTGGGSSGWQQLQLTSDVTGVLPVANGGTGAASLTSLTLPSLTSSNPTLTGTVAGAATYLTPTLTSPTVADFTNATHSHANNAGGGQLTGSSAIVAGTVTRTELGTMTRKAPLIITYKSTAAASVFPNAADNSVRTYFQIPDDYVSGDLTINVWIRGDTSGNVSMYRNTYRFRQSTAYNQIDSAVYSTIAMGTGSILWQFTTTAANFQAGDTIRYDLHRDGANGSDTAASDEDLDAAWVEYLGKV